MNAITHYKYYYTASREFINAPLARDYKIFRIDANFFSEWNSGAESSAGINDPYRRLLVSSEY